MCEEKCGTLLRWHACTCVLFPLHLFISCEFILYREQWTSCCFVYCRMSAYISFYLNVLFMLMMHSYTKSNSVFVWEREREAGVHIIYHTYASLEQLWRIVYQCAVSFWGSSRGRTWGWVNEARLFCWKIDVHVDMSMRHTGFCYLCHNIYFQYLYYTLYA